MLKRGKGGHAHYDDDGVVCAILGTRGCSSKVAGITPREEGSHVNAMYVVCM